MDCCGVDAGVRDQEDPKNHHPGTTEHSEIDDYDDEEEADLEELLSTMDIDKDFDLWTSFNNSMRHSLPRHGSVQVIVPSTKINSPGDRPNGPAAIYAKDDLDVPPEKKDHPNDPPHSDHSHHLLELEDETWAARIAREEVYSRLYQPSDEEKKELADLAAVLSGASPVPVKHKGLHNQAKKLLRFRSAPPPASAPDSAAWAAWHQVVRDPPANILLKRGPVLWLQSTTTMTTNGSGRLTWTEQASEVLLLTHALVLATVTDARVQHHPPPDGSPASPRGVIIPRHLQRVVSLDQVEHVKADPDRPGGWEVKVRTADSVESDPSATPHTDDSVWHFVCSTPKQRDSWLEAWERVLIEHLIHSNRRDADRSLGWQYKYIHKPAFTMAVTNQSDAVRPPDRYLHELDSYNGYSPLHYAVRCQHVKAIQCLLLIGADPNLPDAEGHSPMYYAERDEVAPSTLQLLEAHGGWRSPQAVTDDRGALFGRVAAVEEAKEIKREQQQQQQQQQAREAQQKMNENLRLLQQRGDQIEELGSKASQLNQDAKDFASMAKQLKEQTKKKSAWFPL